MQSEGLLVWGGEASGEEPATSRFLTPPRVLSPLRPACLAVAGTSNCLFPPAAGVAEDAIRCCLGL